MRLYNDWTDSECICSYFVLYQSTATIIANFNSASFNINDFNMRIGQINTFVLIVLKQCSEVYPCSILLIRQISIRRIVQFGQTDFKRLIERMQLTLIRA